MSAVAPEICAVSRASFARPDASPPSGLFVVSDPSRLWFVLDVSEKDLNAVRRGAEVRLATGALGDERAHGGITHVADVVDPQTRTVKVRGTVKNSERRLKAEMFVTAEIKVPAEHRGRLLEMGLLVGTPVELVRFAPLGDPMEIRLNDYRLSLRRSEAARVQVAVLKP